MGDGSLSKEEIDALLVGADDSDADSGGFTAPARNQTETVNKMDAEALASLSTAFNEAMAEAASAASTMAGKPITIENASLLEIDSQVIANSIASGDVVIQSSLGEYQTFLVFDRNIANQLVMSMMEVDEPPETMDEANLSTIGELGNGIFSSLSKNLGMRFKDNLTPSSPITVEFTSAEAIAPFSSAFAIQIDYQFSLADIQGKMVQYIDASGPAKWAQSYAPSSAPEESSNLSGLMSSDDSLSLDSGAGSSVSSVSYPSFQDSSQGGGGQMPPNVDLLMDVQMVLTVELGRTKKYVKDIFQLGEGSIIELDKLAGEPVDLLANGKLIAKGEVVVIDENFGVRVTDIVGPAERIARMNER